MKLALLLHLLLLYSSLFAQWRVDWHKEVGGFAEDKGVSLCRLANGNLLYAGESASDEGEIVCGNYGNTDVILNVADSAGNILWQENYGGLEDDYLSDFWELPNGEWVFCGYSQSSDQDLSLNRGGFDYWVMKLSATGIPIWSKTYGGSSLDMAKALVPHPNGGFLVGGLSHSLDGDRTQSKGNSDFWLVYIDDAGNLIWEKSFGGSADDRLMGMCRVEADNFLLVGESFSQNGDLTQPKGGGDIWGVKIDEHGNLLWQKSYGGSLGDYGLKAVYHAQTNSYLLVGQSYSQDGDFSQNNGKLDACLLHIQPTGALVWAKNWGGSEHDVSAALKLDPAGNWVLGMNSFSNNGNLSGNFGNMDMVLARGDMNGNLQFIQHFGGLERDELFDVLPDKHDSYFINGLSRSPVFQARLLHGNGDMLWAKIAPLAQTISQNATDASISIRSQTKLLQIQATDQAFTSVELIDMVGNTVRKESFAPTHECTIAHSLPQGIYVVHIITTSNRHFFEKVRV